MTTAIASLTGENLSYHYTPLDLYADLVRLFGEQSAGDTRWVSIGAGTVALTFFPERAMS